MPSTAKVVYTSPAFMNQKISVPRLRPPTAHSVSVFSPRARRP